MTLPSPSTRVRYRLWQTLMITTVYLTSIMAMSSPTTITNTATTTVASKFKSPNSQTPPNLKEQWSQHDKSLLTYITAHIPAVLNHTGAAAFDEHLQGVQSVLRHWNAPTYLCNAGLFHSIYGTEGFQGFSLPLSERQSIKELIGEKAERLCWMFCMVDRYTVDQTVFHWGDYGSKYRNHDDTTAYTFQSRPELGRFVIPLHDKEEWLDFIELTLADWLEQVEGASIKPSKLFHWKVGEAYAYRRNAYKRMSIILSEERPERLGDIAPRMYREVMETEVEQTRRLVQTRTPPMSEAARCAIEALRSSGELLPEEEMLPQPMGEMECGVKDKAA